MKLTVLTEESLDWGSVQGLVAAEDSIHTSKQQH